MAHESVELLNIATVAKQRMTELLLWLQYVYSINYIQYLHELTMYLKTSPYLRGMDYKMNTS